MRTEKDTPQIGYDDQVQAFTWVCSTCGERYFHDAANGLGGHYCSKTGKYHSEGRFEHENR